MRQPYYRRTWLLPGTSAVGDPQMSPPGIVESTHQARFVTSDFVKGCDLHNSMTPFKHHERANLAADWSKINTSHHSSIVLKLMPQMGKTSNLAEQAAQLAQMLQSPNQSM